MGSPDASPTLAPWEVAMIDSFVRAAALIGLPRSIGEIYGLLYCSPGPLTFDEIEARLGFGRPEDPAPARCRQAPLRPGFA